MYAPTGKGIELYASESHPQPGVENCTWNTTKENFSSESYALPFTITAEGYVVYQTSLTEKPQPGTGILIEADDLPCECDTFFVAAHNPSGSVATTFILLKGTFFARDHFFRLPRR